MPRASWSVHKIYHILLKRGDSECSQTKSKQAGPGDTLGRDNTEKKGSMAGLPKVKLGVWGIPDWASKVMCSRYKPLLLLKREGIYKLQCCGEHFFNASQHPLSTYSFHQSPKFHLGIHVFPEKLMPPMSVGNNDWLKIEHVTWVSPVRGPQVFGWKCWDKATFPYWWAWQRSSVSHLKTLKGVSHGW